MGAKDSKKAPAKKEPRPRPRKPMPAHKPTTSSEPVQLEGSKDDPVCWHFLTKGYCAKLDGQGAVSGVKCKWMHSYPPGYDPQKAKDALLNIPKDQQKDKLQKDREDGINRRRKPDPATSEWAKKWRELIRCVLPLSAEAAAPYTDLEVRKLAMALWKDIIDWVGDDPADLESSQVLGLFRAE